MYDDNSDTSDINADEIDKILENMEDLDNALLRGTLKTKDSKKETTKVVETKKKVAFQDFNGDDPLADLLSEEDSPKEIIKPAMTSQNKKIADLFGIKSEESSTSIKKPSESNVNSVSRIIEESKSDTISKENYYGNIPTSIDSGSEKTVPKRTKSLFNDDDDIVSNLTDKKPVRDQTKKSFLMEDLFGGLSSKTSSLDASSRKSSVLPKTPTKTESNSTNLNLTNLNPTNLNPMKIESEIQSQSKTRIGYSPTTTISVPRESRRGRRPSGISDPLGLLSTSQSEHVQGSEQADTDSLSFHGSQKTKETASKAAIDDDLPEWLGGRKNSKEGKSEEISVPIINSKQSGESAVSTTMNKSIESTDQTVLNQENGIVFPQYASMLLGTQFDQQAAFVAMQQQENMLRTATSLSQQNDKFSNLLENQKYRQSEQEKQFNMLITRQIERQSLLEAQMKLQQDRIDGYLQTLMALPSSMPSIFSGTKTMSEIPKDQIDEKTESESLVQKLQLEKIYLENTVECLKEKHEKEIMILDDSYKKQVHILEDMTNKLERKVQINYENLEADYEAKIQKLKEEMIEMEKIHKAEKEELQREHVSAIQQIYNRHSQNINLLQNEHAEIIQNISKAKTLEQEAVKTFSIHKENIDDVLIKTDKTINSLQTLQKKIEERNDTFHESREVYFQTQVDHLKLMKEQLEKQNETSEIERKQMIIAAQKLETSAIKLASDTQKRNFQYSEIEDRLKMKEQALVRERELFLEQTKWERKHLEAMKDDWNKEQERLLDLIAKEREVLIVEKGKLEISNRLKSDTDDVAKVELEAMIKSAQDAATSAFQERRKWQERIDEVELQKKILQEKEDQLVMKAKELENLTQSALSKREEGLRALKEARRIEEESKERMNQLQTQLEILAQRENRIAAEKLSLARERLSLRIGQIEKPEKDINVMELEKKFVDEPTYLSDVHSSIVKTHFTDVVDPQLILLKLDLDNKLDASNDYFNYIHGGKH